jgi:hypothetical protein
LAYLKLGALLSAVSGLMVRLVGLACDICESRCRSPTGVDEEALDEVVIILMIDISKGSCTFPNPSVFVACRGQEQLTK